MAHPDNTFEKAKAYEGTITLPTYEIRGENRNPVFHSQYGVAHIYPYPLLDDIAPTPRDKTYRTLNLENRYLRVTVLPDLGGRVYSVYDKVSGREVFYKNSVIKFAPLAIRGAFFSGGVEFSFPVAHAPTTADPVNWSLRENEDGSATIACGGLEHMSRMRWTISLTLYPDRCALAQDVQLQNPSPIPGRYHYWTNASLDADDQTEFVYPLRRVRSYEFAGTTSWPGGRIDLITEAPGLEGMEGVPKWPAHRFHQPINFRWQKNMIAQVSIFGRDVEWDFFGAWQHSSNHGYAHCADHRDVSGMKLWSWGNAGAGIMNQAALTDDGSLYAETQCGAMETQLDFDFLPPGRTRRWREWWLPLRGLGGLTCASAEMGARIGLARSDNESQVTLTIGICPARPLGRVTVKLSVPGKTLLEREATVAPEKPWLHTAAIDARELAGHPITLTVVDDTGKVVLDYTHNREVYPVEPFPMPAVGGLPSAVGFYNIGLKHENFDNREEALKAYRSALALDPWHGPSHLRLGLMLLRAADFASAAAHLRQAVATGQIEANYYLGTLLLYQDNPEEAEVYFNAVPGGTPASAPALCGRGRIALGRGEWERAGELFRQARAEDASSITAWLLLAMALRRAGREEEARRELEDILLNDPLNHPALREMALAMADEGAPYAAKLRRLLADDRQYVLDLACCYMDARLFADALTILRKAANEWDYPMVCYLAGELCLKMGEGLPTEPHAEAVQWFERGAEASPDFVFPSRLEEIRALMRVVAENPRDYKAKYYLGNFLYYARRFEEGIKLWEEAAAGLESFDTVHRNLGLACWQRQRDLERATTLFEKALQVNPQNQDLYLHLDDLYVAQQLTGKREALLEKMRALTDPRDDLHKRVVVMLVDLGHYEQAIEMLTEDRFVPSEMDQSFRLAYVGVYLKRAQAQIEAGRIEEAIADYRRALEFPENVGVGRPVSTVNAEILYRLGCACEQLGRFDEAVAAWQEATREHHPHGTEPFPFVQMSLDKLNRYSELGFQGD
jgi:tetratricopeptide (TPR) repeat protein